MIHLRKSLSDSWCGALLVRGDCLTDDPEITSCPECLRLEEAEFRLEEARRKEQPKLSKLEMFGEGTYGELDWIALGVMTCGLGIPVVSLLKHLAKSRRSREK
jgi:hypothetical protein